MTSALQLNAMATVLAGDGLGTSSNLASEASTLRSSSAATTIVNVYSTISSANSMVRSDLTPLFSTLASSATYGHYLLDLYPSSETPACSGNVSYYLTSPLSTRTASLTKTLEVQASMPFSYGMQGFANIYTSVSGYIMQNFDAVASVDILDGTTYAESGLGYTGPLDLATSGIGTSGTIIANAVSKWGTMYDITNINGLGDPYIFGQNLINQGFGIYGNLGANLTAAGLNISNLSRIPQTSSRTTQTDGTVQISTSLGVTQLPTINSTSVTTTVTGNSPDVVTAIYQTITGANLSAITNAANITIPATSTVISLNDYLTLSNVIDQITYQQLQSQGVTTLTDFGKYLQKKVGQGSYTSWQEMADFLRKLEVPALSAGTVTTASTEVLLPITKTTVNQNNTGAGILNNQVLSDHLGACAGMPHVDYFKIINANVSAISSSIGLPALVIDLKDAVDQYIIEWEIWANSQEEISPGPPPVYEYTEPYPTTTNTVAALTAINSALESLPATPLVTVTQTAYQSMIDHLAEEVSNLVLSQVTFNAGFPQTLRSFAERIGTTTADKEPYQAYQFFANIMTQDAEGDTIRLARTETINNSLLAQKGIIMDNDPNPALVLYQAQLQNIPLNTYLLRNQ